MEIKPKQCIIIGGGASIKEGISLGLWDKLKNKFTININFSYHHLQGTFITFVDLPTFYCKEYRDLIKQPLIIGKYDKELVDVIGLHSILSYTEPTLLVADGVEIIVEPKQTPIEAVKKHFTGGLRAYNFLQNNKNKLNKLLLNTILLKDSNEYDITLNKGVYCSRLSGLFGLSLAIKLLNIGEIFCLGFDGGTLGGKDNQQRWLTHYYQNEIEHHGIGHSRYYEGIVCNKNKNYKVRRMDSDFDVFKNLDNIKIYNVSPKSNINTFEKIDYSTFFNKLDNEIYDQNILREKIKKEIRNVQSYVIG